MKPFLFLALLLVFLPLRAEAPADPGDALKQLLGAIDSLNVKSRGSTAWIRACKSSKTAFRAMDELKRFSKSAASDVNDLNAVAPHAQRLMKYADVSSLQCRCIKSILDTTDLDSRQAISSLRTLSRSKPSKKAMCR